VIARGASYPASPDRAAVPPPSENIAPGSPRHSENHLTRAGRDRAIETGARIL